MIDPLRRAHTVRKLCQVLNVSRSGYYAHRTHKPGKREQQDVLIRQAILKAHHSAPSYGIDPLYQDVREKVVCGRNRVRRLMREMNIHAIRKRSFRIATTNSKHGYRVAANRIKGLPVVRPNQVWVSDITYIPTAEGFLYLAVVKDKFTREIVGYSSGNEITSQLAQEALLKAIVARKPNPGLIHHSDRGVQYCCHAYQALLWNCKIQASMSRKGNPYDNAMAENFFSCLKCERLHLETYPTRQDAKLAVFEYIDGFYNRRRRHSALGWLSPSQFFRAFQAGFVSVPHAPVGEHAQCIKADGVSKTATAARRGAVGAL